MDVLITGGNGFLGRRLVSELLEGGHRVRVLALPTEDTSWLEDRDVKVFRGDLTSPGSLKAPVHNAECVFHLAAMIGAWSPMRDYYAVNVTATESVCRAALAARVHRLIHISSAMVYNMAIGRPVTEDDPLRPLNEPYSVTKAEGDKLVQRMIARDNLPAVIIRPATLFGPGDCLNFGRIAERVSSGKNILVGSGNNAVPLVYVTDVVQGLLLAMHTEQAVGQIYNIGSDEVISQRALFRSVAHDLGARPPHLHIPYNALYAAAYAAERAAVLSGYRIPPFLTRHGVKLYGADNRLSIRKAQRDLGYMPHTTLRQGLRLAADWYLSECLPTPGPGRPASIAMRAR
jgi:nucleoside-diphosphate-sugar epimerase